MARIVLGIGASHSPLLCMEPGAWRMRGDIDDKTKIPLLDLQGSPISYADLLAGARSDMHKELEPSVLEQRHERNQNAIRQLSEMLYAARPDAIVMFGDDHYEVFGNENMPSISVHWGPTLPYKASKLTKWNYDPQYRSALWYPDEDREYPVHTELGRYIAESLSAREFDVAQSTVFREGVAMSHSYAFVYWRLMSAATIATVPIHLNTYFPPNQPSPARCYKLGKALRDSIEQWESDARVVIIATGGLSHFVVDEELDREFLEVLGSRDIRRYANLPLNKLNSGNSELRNWIGLAGAVDHMTLEILDYVPCYRTEAGTGCAMAFAAWTSDAA